MKKLVLMICLVSIMAGCSKGDDELTTKAQLNVRELTTMIGKTPEQVKSSFSSGKLENESSTLGKAYMRYGLETEDVNYSVTFKGNTDGKIAEIDVYGSLSGGYSNGVEVFKREMDRINSSVTHETYIARYTSPTMDFTDRNEFWKYVADHDVDISISEIWWIENSATVKFTVDGTYSRSTNAISIEIERKVW